MYTFLQKLARRAVVLLCGLGLSLIALLFMKKLPVSGKFVVALVSFALGSFISSYCNDWIQSLLHIRFYQKEDTRLLEAFLKKMRFCYTLDDLIEIIHSDLELASDCAVLYVDVKTGYVVYNTDSRLVTAPETLQVLTRNFESISDGVYLFDEKLGLTSRMNVARGFFIAYGNLHFYVFCRYLHVFVDNVFEQLRQEFIAYQHRAATISDLSTISELAKEWSMVADTQKSFLPLNMPNVNGLDLAAYFRPLVNVSGDYYDVLPIDENRTLLMLGDVSGKGLAAALVMGVVINTIKILGDKTDLEQMIRSVDTAIKGMHLQDKYTVLFVGIVDTKAMTLRYVNASMADPLIISRSSGDYEISPLGSNCGVVGIIDIDDLKVDETKLHAGDMILMASDGVSEVMDDSGVELGDTELYSNTIKNSANKSAQHFVNSITDLVFDYNGGKKLRDDVTMLVAKVEG